jgi:hypothetical protein
MFIIVKAAILMRYVSTLQTAAMAYQSEAVVAADAS